MQKVFVAPVKIAIEAENLEEAADLITDIMNEYLENGILDWKFERAAMDTTATSAIYMLPPADYQAGKVFK